MRAISLGVGRDEAGAARALRHRGKARPADAGAPQRRGAAVLHHRRAIAGAIEIDRLEILVLLQPDAVEHIARQDRQAGALGAERDRLADEIADGLVGAVGAHHEHARAGIHRGEDFQPGRRPADAHEGFIGRLARHQRDIELAGFQQRNVFVAALGVARLDRERRIGGVHDFGEGIAIEREAAARRRRPQTDRGLWYMALPPSCAAAPPAAAGRPRKRYERVSCCASRVRHAPSTGNCPIHAQRRL